MAHLIGTGTVLNVTTVVLGSLAGMAAGDRLPQRVRDAVTDCLGLTTLLMALLSAWSVTDAALVRAVGRGAPMLVVLGSLVLGTVAGSLLRVEDRLAGLAGAIQARVGGGGDQARERFVQGWLTSSLLFCVGPLTILGSLDDGLGRGIEQLALKSTLDGFAAVAFAASFGVGVLASAGSVAVVQGLLTAVGALLGSVLTDAQVSALTATGGLMLAGIALRLLRVRDVPVGDMLPALLVAPVLTALVASLP